MERGREARRRTSRARARSCGRRSTPIEWRVNVTQLKNADGRADRRHRRARARAPARSKAAARRATSSSSSSARCPASTTPTSSTSRRSSASARRAASRPVHAHRRRRRSAAPTSPTRSASTAGRSRCTSPATWTGAGRTSRVARLQPAALPHAGAATEPARVRQPAGRRPLRLDDARGPIGRARVGRLLRHGPGRRHRRASCACRQSRLRRYCAFRTCKKRWKAAASISAATSDQWRIEAMFKKIALAAALFVAAAAPAPAQAWPAKIVHIIVPFGAGSTPDIVARIIADRLKQNIRTATSSSRTSPAPAAISAPTRWRRRRPTAAPSACRSAARSPSTRCCSPSCPTIRRRTSRAITQLITQPSALAVNSDLKVNTVADLVALLKANPGKYNFASIGNGSLSHLAMEAIAHQDRHASSCTCPIRRRRRR